jgi:hypothetical protein
VEYDQSAVVVIEWVINFSGVAVIDERAIVPGAKTGSQAIVPGAKTGRRRCHDRVRRRTPMKEKQNHLRQ